MSKSLRSALIYTLLILVLIFFSVHIIQQYWNRTLVDFPSYYYGTQVTFVKELSPYTRNHWNKAIMLFGKDQDLYPYVYLPPSLLFFYPLLYFDYQTIQSALTVGSLISLAIIFWLFFYQILGLAGDSLLPLAGGLYLAIAPPVNIVLKSGQIDLIILLLICVVWWAVKNEKHAFFIIVPLVVAIIMKLYPLIILLFLFIQKKFKIIAWVLVIVIVLSLISVEVLPEKTWNHWYDWVGSKGYGEIISTRLNPSGFGNQNINAFFSRLFLGRGDSMASPIGEQFDWPEEQRETINHWLIYGTVALVGLITIIPTGLYSLAAAEKKSVDLEFSLTLILMLLIAPISNINHLVYSIPAFFTIIYLLLKEARSKLKLALVILAAVVFIYPFNLSNPAWRVGYKVLFLSPYFYSILVLWFVSISMVFSNLRISIQDKHVGRLIREWVTGKNLSK